MKIKTQDLNCRWATRKEQAMNTQKASKLGDEVEVPEELK